MEIRNLVKILIVIILFTGAHSCTDGTEDYVTFKGKIVNPNSDSLVVYSQREKVKLINLDEYGNFSDTLRLDTANVYNVFDGKEYFRLFLRNGYDLDVSLDAKEFDETLKFRGRGARSNNYFAGKTLLDESLSFDEIMKLDSIDFLKRKEEILHQYEDLIKNHKRMDSAVMAIAERSLIDTENSLVSRYENLRKIRALNGQMVPPFLFESNRGGKVSLTDLRGKYVYLDLWATWCKPCLQEIPFLKELESAYQDQKIAFVSISLDRKRDYEKWKDMVQERELTGLQLYYNEDKEFTKALNVTGIPRFILIDPEGRIIDSDAPRPSQPELKKLLNTLPI